MVCLMISKADMNAPNTSTLADLKKVKNMVRES
jgi:hypothetical protein